MSDYPSHVSYEGASYDLKIILKNPCGFRGLCVRIVMLCGIKAPVEGGVI